MFQIMPESPIPSSKKTIAEMCDRYKYSGSENGSGRPRHFRGFLSLPIFIPDSWILPSPWRHGRPRESYIYQSTFASNPILR